MKYLTLALLFIVLFVISFNCYSQDDIYYVPKNSREVKFFNIERVSVGLGVTKFRINTSNTYGEGTNDIGMNFSMNFSNLYFDFSSNFVSGKGEYLDWRSGYGHTYRTPNVSVTSVNVGYSIPIGRKILLTPIVGLTYSKDVIQDDLRFMTYYYDNVRSIGNVGAVLSVDISKNFSLYVSGGLTEYKVGLSYIIW